LNINFFLHYFNYASLLIPILLFFIGYLVECQIIENKNIELSSKSSKGNYLFKLIVNCNKARLSLFVGLLLKAFILVIDLMMFKSKGQHLFEGQLVYWLFVSPLLIFNYVFNNTWGFWKNIWLNYELRSGNYRDIIKFNLRLMFIPLAIDALITIPILLFSWSDYQFIILFYFVSSSFLICTSFVWSLLFPMVVSSSFQMKGSSSFVSSIVSMASVVFLSVIKMNNWFYILIPIYLIGAFSAYKLAIDLYKDKKYMIAKKLMNE